MVPSHIVPTGSLCSNIPTQLNGYQARLCTLMAGCRQLWLGIKANKPGEKEQACLRQGPGFHTVQVEILVYHHPNVACAASRLYRRAAIRGTAIARTRRLCLACLCASLQGLSRLGMTMGVLHAHCFDLATRVLEQLRGRNFPVSTGAQLTSHFRQCPLARHWRHDEAHLTLCAKKLAASSGLCHTSAQQISPAVPPTQFSAGICF